MDIFALPRAGVATALGAATAARNARVFHPRGVVHECRLTVHGTVGWGAAIIDRPSTHDGVIRLSRGLGLPEPLPDVDGFALRLPGQGVNAGPLDILVNSAWRFGFAPTALSSTWSSVLPYRTAIGEVVLLGARPSQEGFQMLVAPVLGRWEHWGDVEIGDEAPGVDLRTNPRLGADDLQPTGVFWKLRDWAYIASQAAR
jgi:hypothetical protein